MLGLQHMFAMFGATVLVPILVQSYGCPEHPDHLVLCRLWHPVFSICARSWRFRPSWDHPFAFLGGFSAMANLDTGKYAAMAPRREAPVRLRRHCGGGGCSM